MKKLYLQVINYKIQYTFVVYKTKTLSKLGREGDLIHPMKAMYKKNEQLILYLVANY